EGARRKRNEVKSTERLQIPADMECPLFEQFDSFRVCERSGPVGEYRFRNLQPDQSYLSFVPPDGRSFTRYRVPGSTRENSSAVYWQSGRTLVFRVGIGANDTMDAGLIFATPDPAQSAQLDGDPDGFASLSPPPPVASPP